MNTPTTVLNLPLRRAGTPRGTRIANAAARLWLRLAPEAPPTRVREAAEVRRLAAQVSHSDPGFAADLYAAADRHERVAPASRD
jgi:hypothetical protein